MSRRTSWSGMEDFDLERDLRISVGLSALVSSELVNSRGGTSYRPTTGIEAVTVGGVTGIAMKGVATECPYWLNDGQGSTEIVTGPGRILIGTNAYTLSFYAYNRGKRGHGWVFSLVDQEGVYCNSDALGLFEVATSYYGNANNFNPFWGSAYSGNLVPSEAWSHVAVVYAGETASVYVDGEVKAENSVSAPAGSAYGISLRANHDDATNTSQWVFRQLKFYNNRALSEEEVKALYEYETSLLTS